MCKSVDIHSAVRRLVRIIEYRWCKSHCYHEFY